MADVLNTSTLEMRMSVNEGGAPYTSPPWLVITPSETLTIAWDEI